MESRADQSTVLRLGCPSLLGSAELGVCPVWGSTLQVIAATQNHAIAVVNGTS